MTSPEKIKINPICLIVFRIIPSIFLQVVEDALESLAVEKGLTLNIDLSRAPQSATTDPLRIQQIVTNLVSNAIHYTDSGFIQITCYQLDSDSWSITVQDSGIGISEADRFRIFDPFVQSSFTKQSDQSPLVSTGLGLAIVQRMVSLLNGTIEVASEPGEGSTFTVTMPLVVSK